MFCIKCGKQIPDHAGFCPYCGAQTAGSRGQSGGDSSNDPAAARNGYTGTGRGNYIDSGNRTQSSSQSGRSDRSSRSRTSSGQTMPGGTNPFETNRGRGNGPGRTPLLIAIAAVAVILVVALLLFRRMSSGTDNTASASHSAASASEFATGTANPDDMTAESGADHTDDSVAAGSISGSSAGSVSSTSASDAYADVSQLTGYDAISGVISNKFNGLLRFVSSDVTEYPTVKLYYSYTDSSGQPITLTSPTAGIRETISGGAEIERTIKRIERLEGNQGLSIDLVADKSASMSGDLAQMQMIMQQFVQNMDFASGDRAEIISFDSYIMYMCTYTQDVSLLQNGISNMTAYGDTALYDALVTGINNAASQPGARCVIGFTDGEDNRSIYTPQDVIRLAVEKEVPVYIIGTGMADYSTLSGIAMQTGGNYWSVDTITDLGAIMQEIYSNQKDLYCIEYESDASADAYASRTVSCVVADEIYGGTAAGVSFQATQTIQQTTHATRYEIIQGDVSWTQANDACIAKGGHLATITSQAEMDELSALATQAGIKCLWIGGYTSVRDNSAFGHWITGEAFDYAAWYPGEPSRNDKDGTPEFYLMMWNVNGGWSWNDQRDDVVNSEFAYFKGNVGYICEYEN